MFFKKEDVTCGFKIDWESGKPFNIKWVKRNSIVVEAVLNIEYWTSYVPLKIL